MKKFLLAGAAYTAISAQALAAPSAPAGQSAVGPISTLVVPVQSTCKKGYHYGYCTHPVTGRKYRGCCPD
jgi:hypothetical protein